MTRKYSHRRMRTQGADADDLAEITKLIEDKKIKPIVTLTLPLAEAAKALQQAATHHTRGKMVLKIADEPQS